MTQWQIWIDRGGTFTDLVAKTPNGHLVTHKLLSENPEKYKPQFGGHCAMSMAMGMLEPTQIDTWSIINGRLVLQRNQKAVKMWSMDKQGNLIKADDNWPKILKKKGKKG